VAGDRLMRGPAEPERDANKHWIGEVQPIGVVVTAAALAAQALVPAQQTKVDTEAVQAHLTDPTQAGPALRDSWVFFADILNWRASEVAGAPGGPEIPDRLRVTLPASDTILEPHLAVVAVGGIGWQLLVRIEGPGVEPDRRGALPGWEATPHQRFERLLRDTGVPTGLLVTDNTIRVVHAPKGGESSGWLEVPLRALGTVAGRSMLGGVKLLLDRHPLLADAPDRRLPALLEASRRAQAEVSTKLATQVLGALHALLHGLHAASPAAISAITRDQPSVVYEGLLAVLMRLVFLLYAEDRGLIPSRDDAVARAFYDQGYGVRTLHTRLLEDAALHPDTMDERRGAWHRLLALFRLVHSGEAAGWMKGRGGKLFDPITFPFLQGQTVPTDPIQVAPVSDGCIRRVLDGLLTLDGELLSYRALDVEQIGSVYETVIGFTAQIAAGPSLAIKAGKRDRTPVFVDLHELAAIPAKNRVKWLKENTERGKFAAKTEKAIAAAGDRDQLAAALMDVVDERGSPDGRVWPIGTPLLQPTDERRRTGSHYTPRDLTAPIVRHALEPAFDRIGPNATPDAVLALKVCDPAMGSGAFLVEACRQIAARLIDSWRVHEDQRPVLPSDEDEELHAKRLVAQRCLYGVDRNPMATDLARLSLWLATLARDHEFTFLDHALKSGDSLVGLTARQIAGLRWKDEQSDAAPFDGFLRDRVRQVTEGRRAIREAPDNIARKIQEERFRAVENWTEQVRSLGDATLAAFFGSDKAKARETARVNLGVSASLTPDQSWTRIREAAAGLVAGGHPVRPFHWEIEFPEVFEAKSAGFDAIVGNPPFLAGAKIWPSFGGAYTDWLRQVHERSDGKGVDLAAHFFRRSYVLLRRGGTFGLLATRTICEGDTRAAGLKNICQSNGEIYRATRELYWPGLASVVVSEIWVIKNGNHDKKSLDGYSVPGINSYLLPTPYEIEAVRLGANQARCFRGCDIYGSGFLFSDDEDGGGQAGSIAEMRSLLECDPRNQSVIFPYIGGKELTTHPQQRHHRYVINFAGMTLQEAHRWPDVVALVEAKVKPQRDKLQGYSVAERRREKWWQYGTYTPALFDTIKDSDRVLAISRTTTFVCFEFLNSRMVFSDRLLVIKVDFGFREFCCLQSRVHETWAMVLGSKHGGGDSAFYSPLTCFETFPFPSEIAILDSIEEAGATYHSHRYAVMAANNEGLTKTYNRFHDPTERDPKIQRLRLLHHEMDVAVLRAYGLNDLADTASAEFLSDDTEPDRRFRGRLFWPAPFRAAVLDRLLKLNAKSGSEERARGLAPIQTAIGADELEET
jgi:N-6 DNA Methylase